MKKFILAAIAVVALASTASAGDFTCKNIVKVPADQVQVVYTTFEDKAVTLTTFEDKAVSTSTEMSGSYCADQDQKKD
jgi:hypothetical protein